MKMAGDFILLRVLLLIVARFGVSSHSIAERPSCNGTITSFRDLQAAINQTESSNASYNYVLCVNLQPGSTYSIGYSSTPIDSISLIITGSSQGAGSDDDHAPLPVVKCEMKDYSSRELSLNEYPLVITNSSLVIIEGVQFEGCMRPLQFNQVQRVELRHSKFSEFNPGGALDIFGCPQILVSSCIFSRNTNMGIDNRPYRGNAGGIAIGYDENNDPDHHPNIKISDSVIESNQATGSTNFEREASRLLRQRIFKQRGGGVAFYFGVRSRRASVEILRSSFVNNSAKSAGGGLYISLEGETNSHVINIRDCNFSSNSAYIGAGMVTFYNSANDGSLPPAEILAHTVTLTDSVFIGNSGNYGGAVSNIQLGYLSILNVTNCTFMENNAIVGAALYLQFLLTVHSFVPEKKIIIEDCLIKDNIAQNGVLFATRNTARIQGDTIFKGNTGPAIQALGSLIRFGGRVVFDSNTYHPSGYSGVIYLSAFGQIMLEESVDILFKNNTGREGASIVVVGQSLSADLTEQQLYNPQCFLQYEIPTAPPPTWKVNLTFENNRAIVGPVVYMSGIGACVWSSASRPFFSTNIYEVWRFMKMGDNSILRGADTIMEPDYYIQTTVQYLSISSQDSLIRGYPGKVLDVDVTAFDELMHNTSAFLQVTDLNSSVTIVPSVVQTVAGVGEVEFIYLSDSFNGNATVQMTPSFASITASDMESLDSDPTLTLVYEPCLPGYMEMNKKCVCDENDEIALCDPQNRGLILTDGLWGGFSKERKLVTHICPPGYCDCKRSFQNGSEDVGCRLEYNDPSTICDKTRTGMFCGKCRGGEGVGLLTNHCRSFNKIPQYWVFLIYLVVLVPLLVAIVKLGVHLPTVLRGLIFYVQISPIAVEFLPQGFELKTDAMMFIGSALGLYIPYDFSFHEGMTSLESHGLRYVAPLVALIVVPLAVRFRHPHSKYWYGVWTVIQLMYIMSVRTSVSLLLCPALIGSRVWFYDGTVQCYRGWHILLAVVALLSLLSLVLLVFLTAAALNFSLLRRKVHHWFAKLEPFSVAIKKGIKKDYWWWPVLDLMCKYTLVLTVVYLKRQKVLALINVLALILLQLLIHPYKNKMANYLESFALLVLIVLLGLGNTPAFIEVANVVLWPLFYLPVLAEFIVISAYVGFILWKQLRQQFTQSKKDNPNPFKRSTRATKRRVPPTRSEVSMFDIHEDENDEIGTDHKFTLWEESADM